MPRDRLDRELIALLQADARRPIAGLAEALGVARSTVHDRLNRLEQDGVIRGYTVRLAEDPETRPAQAVVMLSVEQRQTRQVVQRLERYPEVVLCQAISGEFDLFLTVETPHLEDLDALLDELATVEGVVRSRSMIVLAAKFDRRG